MLNMVNILAADHQAAHAHRVTGPETRAWSCSCFGGERTGNHQARHSTEPSRYHPIAGLPTVNLCRRWVRPWVDVDARDAQPVSGDAALHHRPHTGAASRDRCCRSRHRSTSVRPGSGWFSEREGPGVEAAIGRRERCGRLHWPRGHRGGSATPRSVAAICSVVGPRRLARGPAGRRRGSPRPVEVLRISRGEGQCGGSPWAPDGELA